MRYLLNGEQVHDLEDWIAENGLDDEDAEAARSLRPGQTWRTGGGAAPIFELAAEASHPSEIRGWQGTLSADNLHRAADLIDEILRHRCTVVQIVKNVENVRVQTSVMPDVRDFGRVAVVDPQSGALRWSAGDSVYIFGESELQTGVYVSWFDLRLKIVTRAPAGHLVVWIFAPERCPVSELCDAVDDLLTDIEGAVEAIEAGRFETMPPPSPEALARLRSTWRVVVEF